MSYAIVEDVPASWERYARIAERLRVRPPGLILHVAGPTDEGFRVIEIWETRDAWAGFRAAVVGPACDGVRTWAPTTLRELRALAAVCGNGSLARDTTTTEGGQGQ